MKDNSQNHSVELSKGSPMLTCEIAALLSAGDIRDIDYPDGDWDGIQGTGAFETTEDGAISVIVRRTLEIDSANALVDLRRLAVLSEEAATSLAEFGGDDSRCIWLHGVTKVSASVAASLARFTAGRMVLGLRTISDDAAEALGRSEANWLDLKGISKISAQAAKGLAVFKGELDLSGLSTISDEAAKAFADFKGPFLDLGGLSRLSGEAALSLARNPHIDFTSGLTRLSAEVAKALLTREGDLSFGRLERLSIEALKMLVKHHKDLSLGGLSRISEREAQILAKHPGGHLHLDGIANLSNTSLIALCAHKGCVSLGLTEVSEPVAQALSSRQGGVSLPRLTSLSSSEWDIALARKLVEHGHGGSFSGLTYLSEEAVEILARSKYEWLALDGLVSISAGAARRLAGFQGKYSVGLGGLTEISDEAVAALAQYSGMLLLDSIEELSDLAAKAVSQGKGGVSLKGLQRLSQSAAEWLTCPDSGSIKIPKELRISSVRQVAALEGDSVREFIVELVFYFCDVSYSGFKIMSREEIRKLVRGLDSGAQIGAENMPGEWEETFDVQLLSNAFRVYSGKATDISAMRSLFGDRVGQTGYFDEVCKAAGRLERDDKAEDF